VEKTSAALPRFTGSGCQSPESGDKFRKNAESRPQPAPSDPQNLSIYQHDRTRSNNRFKNNHPKNNRPKHNHPKHNHPRNNHPKNSRPNPRAG
jgi:hypothetical protein